MITYLKDLPLEKRKKAKTVLESLRDKMIAQNKEYYELFIAPNEITIQVINDTLKPNPQTHMIKSLDECKQCINRTAARYKDVHKLFKQKRKNNGKKK